MKYICVSNAWGDGATPQTSIVPELITPFEEVKKHFAGETEFTTLREFPIKHSAVIFIDIPAVDNPALIHAVKHGLPYLLIITENLYLQPYQNYRSVGEHAARILSYEDCPQFPVKTDKFRYPGVPSVIHPPHGFGRPWLLGMINDGRKCGNGVPGELYSKRKWFAQTYAPMLPYRFALWGNGWSKYQACKGPLPLGERKSHQYGCCEFSLVAENNNSIPGYTTEKIFNALLGGSIPVYEYYDNGEIPEDCYIDFGGFHHPAELLKALDEMGPTQKEEMRQAGQRFLRGPLGQKFSVETYKNQLAAAIKGYL